MKLCTIEEVADMLRISEEHTRVLVRKKKLKAYKEGRRGGYRILDTSVEEYISKRLEECEV